MRGELIAIGTELLMGETVDTNSAYLAQRLPAMGVEVRFVNVVGDQIEDLVEIFERGLSRSDLIITTGGLGPTDDDLTREAIARVFGEKIETDPDLLHSLQDFFRNRGTVMPPSNAKQAALIPSSRVLSNSRGTAPGWWVEKNGRVIVALPGVPLEMEHMWVNEVTPLLRGVANSSVIMTRTFKTFGLSESAVGETVEGLFGDRNPYLGIYARPDGIQLRLIAKGATEREALGLLAPAEAQIIKALESNIWGVDDETLEDRVANMLSERGLTVAVMESCTGGLLSSSITDVPGSSAFFQGGVVSYTENSKIQNGVDPEIIKSHGVVSASVVESMAESVRTSFGSDLGVGITGVAGPDPVGEVAPGNFYIGIAWAGGVSSTHHWVPPNRSIVKRRAVVSALIDMCNYLKTRPVG